MNKLVLFNNTSTVDSGSSGVTNPQDVVDEQIAIFDANDLASGTLDLTGNNATDEMIIVQGTDDDPIVTQPFKLDQVKRVNTKNYQAYVNQVTHVGFDGANNSLSYTTGDAFIKATRLEKGFEQFPRVTADVHIDSGDDDWDVAKALAESFNSKTGAKSFLRADVLIDQASSDWTDGGAGDVTVDVTEGSSIIIANVASGQSAGVSVGDYVRIGSTNDLSDPVYEVVSVETNDGSETQLEIGLDRDYSGQSATGLDGGVLDSAVDTQDGGLVLTAKDHTELDDYVVSLAAVSFAVGASDEFDGTPINESTSPQTGSGTYEQLRAMEEKFAGIQYGFYYRNYFPQTPEYFADESTNYDIVDVLLEIDNDEAVVRSNNYLNISLAWDTGANIGTQLETFFGV